MQTPPNYQPYQQPYQPYQAPKSSGSGASTLAIVALVVSVVALILSLVLNLVPLGKKDSAPTFDVEGFSIDKNESEYTTSYIYYDGEGDVVTDDRENAYIVVLKVIRTSGGSEYSDEETYRILQIVDGKGTFYTYDSGYDYEVSKPTYRFEIVGSVKLDPQE
jgi:hypothetical protein